VLALAEAGEIHAIAYVGVKDDATYYSGTSGTLHHPHVMTSELDYLKIGLYTDFWTEHEDE
jgi:hypothetical protein